MPEPSQPTPHRYSTATDKPTPTLGRASAHSSLVTLASQGVRFFIQLVTAAALARVLSPTDFGLVAMTMTLAGIVAVFGDFGLSVAAIQQKTLSNQQASNLFWLNTACGACLATFTFASAPLLASVYSRPELKNITSAYAASFCLAGLIVQHQSALRRDMKFATLAIVDCSSITIGSLVAIATASMGMRYWALVLGPLATQSSKLVLILLAHKWLPSLPSQLKTVRPMIRFGMGFTAFAFINYFARNLDKILIGFRWGAEDLGLYTRAYALLMLPIQQINTPVSSVALSAMSRIQNDNTAVAAYYSRAISALSFVTTPLSIFMLLFSEPLVRLVLGPGWERVTTIFRLLAISALFQPLYNTYPWLLLYRAKTKTLLLIGGTATALIGISTLLGSRYSIEAVALCVAASYTAVAWPCLYAASKGLTLNQKLLFQTICSLLAAALMAAVPATLMLPLCNRYPILLICAALSYFGIYFIIGLLLPHMRETAFMMLSFLPIKHLKHRESA